MEENLVEAAEARQKRIAVFVAVIGTITLIASLMLARDILVPLTLAVLLSFVLAPPVLWLGRFGMPRAPAVLAVVIATAFMVMGLGTIVARQIVDLAQSAPQYEANLRSKSQALRIPFADGVFSGAARTFNRLKADFE